MDDSCSFRLMNTRKIRSYISCVLPILSKMSDLIFSLPHRHRHIAIYVVQIIDTMLGRMCLLRDLHFTFLYVVVSISTYI